jgi:hypothetical protein
MVDLKTARKLGLTNGRLKEFFLATEGDDFDNAKKIRELARFRIQERITSALDNFHFYSAVDLAWDSSPINKQQIPLMLYAQGRITEQLAKDLAKRPEITGYNTRGDSPVDISLPKFSDTPINLVRSIVTRRLAAQASKYNSLYPFYKYHPRLQTQEGRFKADVLSERVDIMADQYNYRHLQTQEMRNMLLYGHQMSFPTCAWERDTYTTSSALGDIVSRTYREGINWVLPHPTRCFYDVAHPSVSLNTDTGCTYCGYWNVLKYSDVVDNPVFWNKDSLTYGSTYHSWFTNYPAYWNQYMDTINAPIGPDADMTSHNDRANAIGKYSNNKADSAVIVTEYYVKLQPNRYGICKLNDEVWIRMLIAGDDTVIFSEVMPSTPCAVTAYNEHDGRVSSLSIAHEIMPYQDQLTNLYTQLLEVIQRDLFAVGILNKDVFDHLENGEELMRRFQQVMEGKDYASNMHILTASLEEARESGVDVSKVFHVVQAAPNHSIDRIFRSIAQLLDQVDRNLALSPQELGQIAPREVTATEVAAVATTTESVYSMISDAVDEGRAAKKRIIYESLINKGSDTIEVSVKAAYPQPLVESLGFNYEVEDIASGIPDQDNIIKVRGLMERLVHDYSFSTRDGAERMNNPQTAMTLIQLFQSIVSQDVVIQAMGKDKLYEIINTIFRMTGTGVNLNLTVQPGEDNQFTNQSAVVEAVNELGQTIMSNDARISDLENLLRSQIPMSQAEQIIRPESELSGQVVQQLS